MILEPMTDPVSEAREQLELEKVFKKKNGWGFFFQNCAIKLYLFN